MAVVKLANLILEDFTRFRDLLKKYAENIEIVDPQLKNNTDLIMILCDLESVWGLGKDNLVDPKSYC